MEKEAMNLKERGGIYERFLGRKAKSHIINYNLKK